VCTVSPDLAFETMGMDSVSMDVGPDKVHADQDEAARDERLDMMLQQPISYRPQARCFRQMRGVTD